MSKVNYVSLHHYQVNAKKIEVRGQKRRNVFFYFISFLSPLVPPCRRKILYVEGVQSPLTSSPSFYHLDFVCERGWEERCCRSESGEEEWEM